MALTQSAKGWIVAVLVAIELVLCLLLLTDLSVLEHAGDQMRSWGAMHVYGVFGSLSAVLQFICLALWCSWSVGVAKHLRALGVEGMRHRSTDFVLWWFVPGLNLTRPYQAMVELWKASIGGARGMRDWSTLPTRPWLLVWWTLWVVHSLVMLATLAVQALVDLDAILEGALFAVTFTIRHATMLAAVPLAIALVRQTARNEASAAKRVELESSDGT